MDTKMEYLSTPPKNRNKRRLYHDKYIDLGFTCFYSMMGGPMPQCVLCSQILANESMKPCKLKRHLMARHPQFVHEPREFFLQKLNELQQRNDELTKPPNDLDNNIKSSNFLGTLLGSGKVENADVKPSLNQLESPKSFLNEDQPSTSQMQTPESYKLRHNNHLSLVLESLARDESFMDVTLTAQGKAIKAHKSVLSAVSPYFKSVLKENPCQHPIIIMPRDINYEELSSIVGYVYKGEMTVATEDLPSLLRTAEILQVTGLATSEAANAAVKTNYDDIMGHIYRSFAANLQNKAPSVAKPKVKMQGPPRKRGRPRSIGKELLNSSPHDKANSYDLPAIKEKAHTPGGPPRKRGRPRSNPLMNELLNSSKLPPPAEEALETESSEKLNPYDFLNTEMGAEKQTIKAEVEDKDETDDEVNNSSMTDYTLLLEKDIKVENHEFDACNTGSRADPHYKPIDPPIAPPTQHNDSLIERISPSTENNDPPTEDIATSAQHNDQHIEHIASLTQHNDPASGHIAPSTQRNDEMMVGHFYTDSNLDSSQEISENYDSSLSMNTENNDLNLSMNAENDGSQHSEVMHSIIEDINNEIAVAVHVCPHCREVHRPTEALTLHLRVKHPTKPSFICKCGRVFVRQSIYLDHQKYCDNAGC